MGRVFAAIDLGASSGRVLAGVIEDSSIRLRAVHRFPNGARERGGHLRWDLTGLYAEILAGLKKLAAEFPQVESIGIDTWGVDYGLLDTSGVLLAEPVAYRDERTASGVNDVHTRISRQELFAINGLQFLRFNTIYQLAAEQQAPLWEKAAHVLLLPDLIAYWLTGEMRTEITNASTTGLLDARTRTWSAELLTRLDIPADLLPPLEAPGEVRGTVEPALCRRLGLRPSTVVTTVGSHDTASAVVGVPAIDPRFAYVSSGTWSLVGLELDAPVVTPSVRDANFTNEAGVDTRTRFLRNLGGLWLLNESMRSWASDGRPHDLARVLEEAANLPEGGPEIDVDDPVFVPPGAMPERIAAAAVHAGHQPPATAADTVRCIIDSLATAYARTVRTAAALAGRDVDVVHVVGGGSQNDLLCQLTADRTHVPVLAGPIEATAIGNVIVQARAHGAAPKSLEQLRIELDSSLDLRRFDPS